MLQTTFYFTNCHANLLHLGKWTLQLKFVNILDSKSNFRGRQTASGKNTRLKVVEFEHGCKSPFFCNFSKYEKILNWRHFNIHYHNCYDFFLSLCYAKKNNKQTTVIPLTTEVIFMWQNNNILGTSNTDVCLFYSCNLLLKLFDQSEK